ncbi:acetate--CoA ligase family protein [Nocardioides hungaricus]
MRDLRPLLAPRSVAVVGASGDLTTLSGKPVRFLRESGADVAVYPVNPGREEIAGYRAYPDPASLPEAPDVGLVVVPGPAVVTAVEALARRGARAAIVVSSGFAEGGADGAAAQERLRHVAREHDMLLLGPNTLGVHDYVRGLPLSFVWYGRRPASDAGSVAVVSQSGSGMTSLCDRLLADGLPLGLGVATGNEADVSIVDVLEHLAEDDRVRVVACVFEQVRDGDRFLAVARRLREVGKPLVALKVGRTESGSSVVRSHTGALAGSYPTLRALMRQYGVLEVTDVDQVGSTVAAALLGRFPATDAIAMVTNSGGAAGMAADRADEIGVPLAELSQRTSEHVAANLPSWTAGRPVHNPIDVTAMSMQRPFAMVDIAEALVADPAVGGVILAVPSGGGPDGVRWAERFVELVRRSDKPVLAVILSGSESDRLRDELRAAGVPVLSSPAGAVEALQRLRRFATATGGTADPAPGEPVPLPAVLTERSTLQWLAQHGLPVVEQRLAATPEEAAAAADAIGYPVAVKVSSPDILHKTEAGGVALDCADADEVRRATDAVLASARRAVPDAAIEGVTVSPMVRAGVELLAGVHHDETFGPVVMLGLGGVWAEVLADVTMRGVPLAAGEAQAMVDDLRGAPLLRGARGRTPVRPELLTSLLETLGRIAHEHRSEIRGLDLNPIAVTDSGSLVILDAAVDRRLGATCPPEKRDSAHLAH